MVTLTYDAKGQLTGLSEGGRTTIFTYTADSLVDSMKRPNGLVTVYGYDTARRLTNSNNRLNNSPDHKIADFHSFLDARGNVTETEAIRAELYPSTGTQQGNSTFTYDQLSRLVTATVAVAPTSSDIKEYFYDERGNQTRIRFNSDPNNQTEERRYDGADRPEENWLHVNDRGNLVQTLVSGQTFNGGYDAENRLITTTFWIDLFSNSVPKYEAALTYDADSLRATKRLLARTDGDDPGTVVTTTYSWDLAKQQPVVLWDGTRSYVWGPQGLLYAVQVGGAIQVPAVDRQGSILALTDGSGNVTHVFDNDAFGVPLDSSSEPLPFGYTGELRDKELGGLVYLRSRHYLSLVGRFTSRDSFGGYLSQPQSQNRYTYAQNNPVNRTDPSGHCPQCAAAAPFVVAGPPGWVAAGVIVVGGTIIAAGGAYIYANEQGAEPGSDWAGGREEFEEHYGRHSPKFRNPPTEEEYDRQAHDLYGRARAGDRGVRVKEDDREGKIRVIDIPNNRFGVYDKDGRPVTYYPLPEGENRNKYWNDQPGRELPRGESLPGPR